MSIEWGKVENKKDKDHKVRGSTLLEMRARMEALEKEVTSLGGKIEGMKVTVETTTNEKDKNIKNLVDEKNKLQTSLEGKVSQLEQKNRELASGLEAARQEARTKAAEADGIKKENDDLKKKLDYLELELQSRDFDFFKKYIKEKSARAAKTFEQKPAP
ncbi:MAG: hypothetical protein JW839_20230 [Candidatus Lokiarchaeota archaeon]|nr:hypothetical protein [Candidatus Lokiarchaeota archaeon]